MKELYLIDASGFLYRAYFAIQGLSSATGEATGALFGFIRSYLKLEKEFQPTHIAAIFDGEKSTQSRKELYAEYKAHRKPTPPELISQIREAERFCAIMGIPMLSVPHVEADDTIGSVVTWAKSHDTKVFICTSDKDMAQLVDEKVALLNPFKDYLLVDKKKVKELYGVWPEQMQDFLAIVGDASDNVPGIQGFGPKTAIELLEKYETLEKIFHHAKDIGGKKEKTLEEQKETALLSKKLVTINCDVKFPKETSFFAKKECNHDELATFLKEKSFHSLLKSIGEHTEQTEEKGNYTIVESIDELNTLLKKLSSENKEICVDTETTDFHPLNAELVGIGLGTTAHEQYYIPLNGKMAQSDVVDRTKKFFENTHCKFFGHNIKYDYHVLKNCDIEIATISSDTILASYLLNAHQKRHSLDELALQYFEKKKIHIQELIGKGKSQITMDKVPIDKVARYCSEDVEYTIKLKEVLDEELKKKDLFKLLHDIEVPLIKVLAKMERRGIFVDVHVLEKLSKELEKEIAHLQEVIFHDANGPFNINSPKQLGDILFNKMGIKPPKGGKDALSTRAEVLEALAENYPIAKKVLEYRSIEKLRSTYIEALPHNINPKTGRVHTQFNQSVTATGRLSCQDPNLQNIPIRSELGKKIRASFRPEHKGWSFLSSDYSQVELRILAHLCEDPALIKAFHNNLDIHAFTAAEVFHVPLQEVTPAMRRKAKAVNFGIIYGQQAFGLSQELGISMQEAAAFISAYFKRYPRVKEYIESLKEDARKHKRAQTLTGRVRLLPEITSPNQMIRSQAERLAVNTPFQGTAADIIKIAMIDIDHWMEKLQCQARMLLQIHDELLFEMPDEEIPSLKKGIKERMEGVFALKVPLIVEIGIGKNWMEC